MGMEELRSFLAARGASALSDEARAKVSTYLKPIFDGKNADAT